MFLLRTLILTICCLTLCSDGHGPPHLVRPHIVLCEGFVGICICTWPHIGAAKWNFWMVKSLTLPQLAATWVCIFEHLRKHTLEFVNRWEDLLWFWWSAMNVESILFNATRSLLMGFVIWPNSIFTYLVRFLLLWCNLLRSVLRQGGMRGRNWQLVKSPGLPCIIAKIGDCGGREGVHSAECIIA